MGHYRRAVRHFQAAAEIFLSAGTTRDRAVSHRGLAWVLGMSGRHDEAMVHAQQAMDLTRDSSLADQAHALNTVGRCHAYLGAYQFAVLTCGQALTLHQRECNRMGQAEAWYSLGLAHQGARQHDESVRAYQQALELFRELGDRHYIGETLAGLGDAHHAVGDRAQAISLWRRALGILDDIRHPDTDRVRAQLGAAVLAMS
jgi:tetratricopeptide (TPR) repeat protein